MTESHELTRGQCETLLRSRTVGRVALSTPTGPHVVPVNYTVVEDAIIVRTTPYSILGTYGRNTTLAFEIDAFDDDRQRGWSVLARGRGDVVEDLDDLAHVREAVLTQPWASGSRSMYIRVRWTELSGRQLGANWDPLDDHEKR